MSKLDIGSKVIINKRTCGNGKVVSCRPVTDTVVAVYDDVEPAVKVKSGDVWKLS